MLITSIISCLLESKLRGGKDFFFPFRATHMEVPWLGGQIGAKASGLHHRHSNAKPDSSQIQATSATYATAWELGTTLYP